MKGYDSGITTGSEMRFSGTAWQTGHMHCQLSCHGIFILVDDSRSGINTSGFFFWNVVIIDQDFKAHVVKGRMIMSAFNDTVYWLFILLLSYHFFYLRTIEK